MAAYAYTDSNGKGHLKIGTAGVTRDALARFNQTYFESEAKARAAWSHVLSACKKFGIDVADKTMPKPKIKEPSSGYKRASALVSTCAVALEDIDAEAPEWIALIPAGKFSAVDGRGPFENEDPASIIAASLAKMPQVGLVLDYDHSTDLAAPEGRPAPAAGWLKGFKIEGGAIFARIEWTADAADALKAKKYRYVSPVFEHAKDGKVERILRAALTNNPALVNLPAIAAAEVTMAKKEDKSGKLSDLISRLEAAMPEASHQHLMRHAALAMAPDKSFKDWADEEAEEPEHDDGGDSDGAAPAPEKEAESVNADDPYEKETAEQMGARQADEMARCADDGARAEMTRQHAAQKERFAKRCAGGMEGGSARMTNKESFDSRVAKHPMVVQMATALSEMRQAQAKLEATGKVDSAIRGGRLVPSQRDWAISYCSAEPAGFEKFIGAQPQIIQSGADGTFTGRIGEAPADALTRHELMVCENLGVPAEKFTAAKKARLSHNVHLEK